MLLNSGTVAPIPTAERHGSIFIKRNPPDIQVLIPRRFPQLTICLKARRSDKREKEFRRPPNISQHTAQLGVTRRKL